MKSLLLMMGDWRVTELARDDGHASFAVSRAAGLRLDFSDDRVSWRATAAR